MNLGLCLFARDCREYYVHSCCSVVFIYAQEGQGRWCITRLQQRSMSIPAWKWWGKSSCIQKTESLPRNQIATQKYEKECNMYIYTYYAHVLLIYCIGFMDILRLQWQHLIPKPCMSRTTPMRTNIKSPHTTEWWLGPIHHPGSRIETRTQETLKSSSTTYSAFFQRKALYVDILCTTDECTSN